MKARQRVCLTAVLFFSSFFGVCAETPRPTISSPSTASGCSNQLEAGGSYNEKFVKPLQVDFNHGISIIYLPSSPLDSVYDVSVVPGKQWLLTYATGKSLDPGNRRRAFRATVPLPDYLAQRIANVWAHAIDDADSVAAEKKEGSLLCINLDGASYIFSSNGRRANILNPTGGIPSQLVKISDMLRIYVMDTKNTGYAFGSTVSNLQQQLDRIESDLKIGSQH